VERPIADHSYVRRECTGEFDLTSGHGCEWGRLFSYLIGLLPSPQAASRLNISAGYAIMTRIPLTNVGVPRCLAILTQGPLSGILEASSILHPSSSPLTAYKPLLYVLMVMLQIVLSPMCNGLQSKQAETAIIAFSGPHYLPVRLLLPNWACNQRV
jgi:hypothetical protein